MAAGKTISQNALLRQLLHIALALPKLKAQCQKWDSIQHLQRKLRPERLQPLDRPGKYAGEREGAVLEDVLTREDLRRRAQHSQTHAQASVPVLSTTAVCATVLLTLGQRLKLTCPVCAQRACHLKTTKGESLFKMGPKEKLELQDKMRLWYFPPQASAPDEGEGGLSKTLPVDGTN
ncbi:unnamed protein product [Pleuronectes platessa]|uniref:Uncharacterized protein n=1 Tax=Pleuronectes platessa TaxID=8262 RepID=A0A9N7URB1_PLEPL|nr:unnamed protein product [Pleuronectes platessa]